MFSIKVGFFPCNCLNLCFIIPFFWKTLLLFMFRNKNFNFPKRHIALYNVTLNMTVTGFCVICVLGNHTDADLHSFLQLCRVFVSFLVEQNEDGPRKFMYLFTCVFTLTEAVSPSFFFSSSQPFSCRLSSPVFFFCLLCFFS